MSSHNSIAVLVTIFMIAFQIHANGNENHVVTIDTGKVKGTVLVSTEGKNYNAFRGIPYAKPPVKELRFKVPQPAESWDGIFDATEDGVICSQMSFFTNKPIGDEDCLLLNVYTPENYVGKSYPVLFYIHGGGFTSGSGNFDFLGPEKYMNMEDVVLVTINYRLGIFGFISTGDENAPGNYGLMDQVLSLKWVQENIAKFGGDPTKVTIFGMSAGGSSVAHLVLSPLSKGLFHAAIAQSGSAIGSYCIQRKPLYWAIKIAQKCNCSTTNTKKMVQCLRETSVEELLEIQNSLIIAPTLPIYLAPVIEPPGGPGFLVEDPLVLLKEGRIGNKVPYITGITKDEGNLFATFFERAFKTHGQEFLDDEFLSVFLPHLAPQVENRLKELGKAMQMEYYGDNDVNDPKIFENGFSNLIADAMFAVSAEVTLNLLTEAGVPTYSYLYNYNSHIVSQVMSALGMNSDKVHHGSDGFIQFRINLIPGMEAPPSKDDNTITKIMNTVWKNFANTKKPSFDGTPIENQYLEWLPYNVDRPNYMEFNLTPQMKEGHLTNKTQFWTEIISKLADQQRDEL